jgi:hypothetical protein
MRAARAGERLKSTFDDILGVPEDVRSVAKDISLSTSGAREAAYTAAYTKPIDYASGAGRSIENVLARVPSKVLRRAVDEANDAMTYAGVKNQQILAEIADDGSVIFRVMPNVQHLDFIKRSLGEIGAESVDQFGRPTGAGIRASKLASDLRDALKEAVPEYGTAVKLGGDKIAEDKALRLGSDVLTRRISRADVKEFARTAADQEIARAKLPCRGEDEGFADRRYAACYHPVDMTVRHRNFSRLENLADQKAGAQAFCIQALRVLGIHIFPDFHRQPLL